MNRPWIIGALIFVGALALRLSLLPTARFGGDEALFFQIGMDIVEGKNFPALGTQITDGAGRLPGPTFLYVMALPLIFFRGPEAQYAFVEILGAVTVLILWHAMRRPFGEKGAAFFGVLMAFSPWSALYADRTWNPNVLPFVVALALLCAVRLREQPNSKWIIPFIPLCAVMPHFHMSAPVAWVALAVLVAPTVKQWNRRHLAIGLGIAFVAYLPLLGHELATGFQNTRNILNETVGGGGNSEKHPLGFIWVPVYALRFLTLDVTYHELTGYWGGPDEIACLKGAFAGTPPRPFHVWRLFAFLCSLGLAGWALFAARRARPWILAFAAGLVANTALMGVAQKQVFGHYVTNLFPFVFVAFAALGQSVGGRAKIVAILLACVFCIGGIEATLSISRRVDGRIGLVVHRRTLEVIRDDGGDRQVRLDFGFRSNWYDWHIFATRAMNMPIHFDRRAKRHYVLVEKHKPLANAKSDPIDVGYALLYRQ
jgi:hypothetical protein